MATKPDVHLHELLEEFGTAMLITRTTAGHLRGRPMAVAQIEADGTLWFASERNSGKIEELAKDSHAAVTMQSGSKFVSLSGTATPVEDKAKIAEIWKPAFKVWFPGGQDDPSLILLKLSPDAGEYWDNSGTSGIKYFIEAGKALLSGTKPQVEDPKIHGKVDL